MLYFVVEIATGDSKIAGKGIYEYTNLTDAMASFHKRLGVAMGSTLYTSDLVMVINSSGGVHANEYFVRETVEE